MSLQVFNAVYSFTAYIGKVFKIDYLPIVFAPLYMSHVLANVYKGVITLHVFIVAFFVTFVTFVIIFSENLSDAQRGLYMLNVSEQAPRQTPFLDSMTPKRYRLNDKVTSLLRCHLKSFAFNENFRELTKEVLTAFNRISPFWGCCFNHSSCNEPYSRDNFRYTKYQSSLLRAN